jgi:hypothetical protein
MRKMSCLARPFPADLHAQRGEGVAAAVRGCDERNTAEGGFDGDHAE